MICWKFCIALPYSLETFLLVLERRLGVQEGILPPQRHRHLLVARIQRCGVGSQEREVDLASKRENLAQELGVVTVCSLQTGQVLKLADPGPDRWVF